MARTFSQRELDRKVVDMVAGAGTRFGIAEGSDGETACAKVGLNLRFGRLGPATDGLLAEGNVIVNRALHWAPRIQFTIFHEIFHYLLEADGEIIEFYTDLLRSDDAAYKAAIERCCHQGAAELLMPQARVRDAISSDGLSVELVEFVAERHGASIVASAIQIARCAPVGCYVVICSYGLAPKSSPPHRGLFVEYVAPSPQIKYTLGRFSPVQDDNLLVQAWEARGHVRGPSYVPFRSATRKRRENRMECQCDAMRLGDRVLGILFLEAPTPPGQLTLSFDDA